MVANKIYGFINDLQAFSPDDFRSAPLSEIANIQAGAGFRRSFRDKKMEIFLITRLVMNLPGNELEMTHTNNMITEDIREQITLSCFTWDNYFPKLEEP